MARRGQRPRGPSRPKGLIGALSQSHLLLALLTGSILILPWWRSAGREDADSWRIPTAYNGIVNDAVSRGWLLPGTAFESGDASNVRMDEGAPDAFKAFARISYLASDMRSLDPAIWRWRLEGGPRLEIEPRAHLIGGPFDREPIWRGDLLFANEEEVRLLDGDRTIAWLNPARPGGGSACAQLPLSASETVVPSGHDWVCVMLSLGGAEKSIAEIRRIGDRTLLRVNRTPGVIVDVGGRNVALDREYQQAWRWFEPNQSLAIRWEGGSRLLQLSQRRPPISTYRANGQRIRDASLESFARPVESAMGDSDVPITTTLLSTVHAVAQAELSAVARPLRFPGGSFRGAAVLLDGVTGEIVALPTFPAVPDDLYPTQVNSPNYRRMLQHNGNFVRMLIGSAAKPPFAFAILNQMPALSRLEILPSATFRTLLGVDLGTEVEDRTGVARFDFRSFLSRSSNKYAASLMLFGLSDPDAVSPFRCATSIGEPFWIGDVERRCIPPRRFLRLMSSGARPRYSLGAAPSWGLYLDMLFCVAHQDRVSSEADPRICPRNHNGIPPIWRNPIAGQGLFQRPFFLAPVTPEPDAFGFNIVDDVHADYLMTILGGNRGRWTTISLAQTYARMLTGRAVTARLIPVRSREEFPLLRGPNIALARRAVLDGLGAVVTEGTGRNIDRDAFAASPAPGEYFRVFAKTGTPAVQRNTIERARLQSFAEAGCGLRLVTRTARQGGPVRRSVVVGREIGSPVAAIRAAAGPCGQFGAYAGSLASEIAALNRNGEALAQIVAAQDGAITRVPARAVEGAGHVVVLMIARYARGVEEPCSVRVVAANLQARVPESRTPAITYVNNLLGNPSVRRWMEGQRCQRAHT